MKKFTVISLEFIVRSTLIFLFLSLLLTTNYQLPTVHAQSCSSATRNLATGLVTTPNLPANFNSSGACIVDPKAGFAPFAIPTYGDLKSLYFDRSKLTKTTITSLPANFTGDNLYWVNGNLTVSNNPTGSGMQTIFVKENLTFNSNYSYNPAQGGTVFIVKGNVNISYQPTLVTLINAIIISEGVICTAYDGSACATSSVYTSQLIVNGSLISINQINSCPDCPIKFRRTLTNNNEPAEKMIQQNKYLVLLRDLISQSTQKWSEIAGDIALLTPPPPTIPTVPQNLTASAGDDVINLAWSAPLSARGSSITSYNIYRGTTSNGQGSTPIATRSGSGFDSLRFTDTTVSLNTPYFYKVTAVNAIGESPQSNEATSNASASLPSAPTNLTLNASGGQMNLSWSAATTNGSAIRRYNIYRATTSNGQGTTPIGSTSNGSTLTYTDNPGAGIFFYKVKAQNGIGEGSFSNEATNGCGIKIIGPILTIGPTLCI